MLFTVDKYGNPGHPTRKLDMAGRLVRRGRARVRGGGRSGKPPVLIFLDRTFDTAKYINRDFHLALDPGFVHTGFALGETKHSVFSVFLMGELQGRTYSIRGITENRTAFRRRRRYLQRHRNKQVLGHAKFKAPRWKNRRKKISKTLHHAVQTQKNLVCWILKAAPLPDNQVEVCFEQGSFDTRWLTWGPTYGADYQKSPRGKQTNGKSKAYVLDRDGGCVICSRKDAIERHHLKQRKHLGTDRPELLVSLCPDCHDDAHKGLLTLPLQGMNEAWSDWRALSTVNQAMGLLRRSDLRPIPAIQVVQKRRELGLGKNHALDAVSTAALAANASSVELEGCLQTSLIQLKRHNRACTKSVRERSYKLNGRVVAQNRRKRCDQKRDSLAEFRANNSRMIGKLKAYSGKALAMPQRQKAPTLPGDLWELNGQVFMAEGVHSKRYIFSSKLSGINGRKYARPKDCRKVRNRSGMIAV